ncbi:MAG: hypothetical protein HRS50_02310, partial [Mycoplasmataceae bacterium]|nr:hypothetical protein [Mycoplasmataceae bacterium]
HRDKPYVVCDVQFEILLEKEKEKISNIINLHNIDDLELKMTYLLDDVSFKIHPLNSKLFNLSISQIQKLSLVKSILEGYEIIILQDPVNDVDSLAKSSLSTAIKKISNDYNVMIIILTKDIKIAETFSDQIVIIKEGINIEQGTPKEIFENPIHPFTKEMIKNSDKIKFLSPENTFVNSSNKNLKYNLFANLKLRKIKDTHWIFSTQDEYDKWNK